MSSTLPWAFVRGNRRHQLLSLIHGKEVYHDLRVKGLDRSKIVIAHENRRILMG